MMINKNSGIQAPWYTLLGYIKAMFGGDPEIVIDETYAKGDDGIYYLTIDVRNWEKFKAIKDTMIQNFNFGNITVKIDLQCSVNTSESESCIEKLKKVFEGNHIVKRIVEVEDVAKVKHGYVIFQPEVIQFYNDDLTDYMGNFNGLAENIARTLFNVDYLTNFCTADLRENEENAEE